MNGDLADLSNEVGPVRGNTAAEQTAALLAALRASRDADEAATFKAMLGVGGDA